MSQKLKLAIGAACFAALFIAATVAYNGLAENAADGESLISFHSHETNHDQEHERGEDGEEENHENGEDSNDEDGNGNNPEESLQKAPNFEMVDAEGNAYRLSDAEGMPVVLNFWASWCPPCKGEMPVFDKAYKERGNEIRFLMVCLADGMRETVDSGKNFVEGEGYAFPVYFDVSQEGASSYGIRAIPATFFIDRDGYLAAGAQGAINGETLMAGIGMIE